MNYESTLGPRPWDRSMIGVGALRALLEPKVCTLVRSPRSWVSSRSPPLGPPSSL